MLIQSALFNEWHPFDSFYPNSQRSVVNVPVDLIKETGFLVVWGGGDIHPALYGHKNVASHVGTIPSRQDLLERDIFIQAVHQEIPIVGVCRGAQLGCIVSGGYLVQDVTGHTYDHYITTDDGKRILTPSLHHQMMYPWTISKGDFEIIATTNPTRSKHYISDIKDPNINSCQLEPEVIWFPKTKCLAIQGHPEFMACDTPFNQYIKILIDKWIAP